ncbi:CcdC protein domain-containing protein [Paenibacillus sp. GP183]|uniref:CcdC protein domain-containing protein n=1 Tax=Paenibacillus sp. GP183 TaxID=1882751 RepID=UPI000895298E|nr:CcdC protein domain-containing protein [Paenibacillus sp. GP183]SEC40826.1 Membrane protein CcdC involved in cytochrome C biogenesis [Paenibacillus sp. GP183]
MLAWVPYVFALIIIGLVIWIRLKRRGSPIKGNGLWILAPVLLVFVLMYVGLYQLMHIPGRTFHLPAYWEIVIAVLLGISLGVIILMQTSYEKREDGLVYSKPNKNFKYVIIAIVIIRIGLSLYFKSMDYSEFTVLTMVLVFVYLCIWRFGSYVKFRQVSGRQGMEI